MYLVRLVTEKMILTLAVAHLLAVQTSLSAPTTAPVDPWTTPCTKNTPTVTTTASTVATNISMYLTSLESKAEYGNSTCATAQTLYSSNNRITIQALLDLLQTVAFPGFPIAEGYDDQKNVTDMFLDDYKKLSAAAIFMDEIMKGETNGNFTVQMQTVSNTIYSMLCDIYTALNTVLGSSIQEYVKFEDVIKENFYVTNLQMIYCRDYTIFRQTKELLNAVRVKYQNKRDNL